MKEVIVVTSGGALVAAYSTDPAVKVTYVDRDELTDIGREESCAWSGEDRATQAAHRKLRAALKRAETMTEVST